MPEGDQDVGRLQPARPKVFFVLLFMLMGGLIGATAGVGFASTQPAGERADAVISVAPSTVVFEDASSEDVDTTALVQSELIILSGPVLRADVQRRLGAAQPVSYSARQVGSSTIVDLDAEAATRAEAVALVSAVVDAYAADRQTRLRGEIDRAAAVVDQELSRLERAIAEQSLGAAALQQEYGRLLAVRSGLFRATANVEQAVTVIQPPIPAGSGVGPQGRWGAIGAVLGALAGLALLMLVNRTTRGIRDHKDLADALVPVLQPEVPWHTGLLEEFAGHSPSAASMRLLVGQLTRPGDGRPLVLFGATADVGTSMAAAATAVCLSERSDVLLVLAADLLEGSTSGTATELGVARTRVGLSTLPDRALTADDVLAASTASTVPGLDVLAVGPGADGPDVLRRLSLSGLVAACAATGRQVVVDAPALADSSLTVDLAHQAGGAALVVGAHVTTRTEVETVRQTFLRQGIRLLGAVISRPSRETRRSSGPRRTGAVDAPPSAAATSTTVVSERLAGTDARDEPATAGAPTGASDVGSTRSTS